MPRGAASGRENNFDVVICGGGLAGLTLARQLRRELPELSILVIEKTARPLPPACHKVGESSVEVGARYFTEVLGLTDYFQKSQLPKLGLRFFFGDASGPFEDRPEFGASRFAPVPSYQIDRGIFEQDLRAMNAACGISLLEGLGVQDVKLGRGGHRVIFRESARHRPRSVSARWVIDASGRRRLLQSKLGLKRENGHNASAVWFRMKGRLDVSDLVPKDNAAWHSRVPGGKRWYSTNHLMGKGYWVWLIPLSSGYTSVGIVADEAVHPFREYATFEGALDWIRRHEPALAAYLRGHKPADFKRMKRFSYSSASVFSAKRWACVGEAGVFTDPFYSPGSDFIAVGNTMVARMLALDRNGNLSEKTVRGYERLYFLMYDIFLEYYRGAYPIFGAASVMTAKNIWDWSLYWSYQAPVFFHGILDRPDLLPRACRLGLKLKALNARVQRLLRTWGARAASRKPYGFLELFQFPILRELHLDLRAQKTPEIALRDMERGLATLRELAAALSRQAVSEMGVRNSGLLPPQQSGLQDQMKLIFS